MKARLLLPSLLLAAACGEGEPTALDAQTVALTADANFRRVGVELGAAVAFLQDSPFGSFCAADSVDPCEPLDPAAGAEALADFLADRIFTEANVESEDGRSVTFRMRPDVVCDQADADCIRQLTALPVRLRVTSDEPGDLDVAVLVGEARIHPFDIGLHAAALEIQADLGALRALLGSLGADTPARMEGRLALGIARHAAGDFTTSLSILEPLAIQDEGSWDLELARALPAIAARVQEADERISVRLGLAALSLRGPLGALLGTSDAQPPEGTLGISLAGLTGEAIIDGASDILRLNGIGLGDETSVVDIDGTPVLTVDLNPLAGRAFDLIATAGRDGTELHFAPSFDLGLGFFFGSAADHFEVPAWALDEMLRIRIDGAEVPRLRLRNVEPSQDGADTLVAEMIDGVLTLGSQTVPTVQVKDGMCLVEAAAATEHPFAGLAAASCM